MSGPLYKLYKMPHLTLTDKLFCYTSEFALFYYRWCSCRDLRHHNFPMFCSEIQTLGHRCFGFYDSQASLKVDTASDEPGLVINSC